MGCNSCSQNKYNGESLISRITDYIKRDDISSIESLLKLQALEQKQNFSTLLDSPFIPVNNLKLSPLSLSIYFGSSEVFNHLHSKLKASVKKMHKNLKENNLSALTLIFEKGFLSLLKFYLPIYLESFEYSSQDSSFSNNFPQEKILPISLPLLLACKGNYLNILQYIHHYFNTITPPLALDIHAIDGLTGENCALISVRTGNFVMMKMLFEVMHCDFHVINKKEEGALQILADSAKTGCCIGYYECTMYLVEVVRIDVAFRYWETFRLLENNIIRLFLKDKLKMQGILIDDKEFQNFGNNSGKVQSVDAQSFQRIFKDLSSIVMDSSDSGFSQSIYN
jgi:hypothetical protein